MADQAQDQSPATNPVEGNDIPEQNHVPAQAVSSESNRANRFRDRAKVREEGEKLTLTSGEEVLVRRPSITNMVKAGIVPANVAGAALKYDSGKPMSDRDVQRLFELKQIVTKAAFISPRIVDGQANYDNDEITFEDLSEDEINDVYMYVQVGLVELTKFREKRQGDATGPDSAEVPGNEA